MTKLTICPNCGEKNLHWDNEKKWSCNACSFVLYHNVASAVAVLVKCGDEILLTKRNQNPAIGKLDLPGGFVDPKESAETTCKRELWEELKIDINTSKLVYITSLPNTYIYKDILYNTLDMFYMYEVDEKPNFCIEKSEIISTVWIDSNNINIDEIAFDSQEYFFETFYTN